MDGNGGRISYMLNMTSDPKMDMERLHKKMDKCEHVVINILDFCRKAIPYAKEHN